MVRKTITVDLIHFSCKILNSFEFSLGYVYKQMQTSVDIRANLYPPQCIETKQKEHLEIINMIN